MDPTQGPKLTVWDVATLILGELDGVVTMLESHTGEGERELGAALRTTVTAYRDLLVRWPKLRS